MLSSLALWCGIAAFGQLPGMVVPEGLGVNIHFTDPRPGEMEMLAGAGVRWIRMDFGWGGTEREKGQYDFRAYERLLSALEAHKIRSLWILDYSNRHYDQGLSPSSDEGRKAFARWAAAAARHFRGHGILWEMYNEPNIGFWKPKPDVKQYVKLALEVGRALREAAPGEAYVGPATSQIDLPFLEECFRSGLLDYWSAVSVHPYRQKAPETAADEYARLRQLIARYAPKGKKIPILSGEWGYSSVWKNMDDAKQGKMLPRQWLTNLANDVPLSIWYDWHDDGPDPKEPEHHFGMTLHPYHAGRKPVYDPTPAYLAAKTLTSMLGGFSFSKRLAVGDPQDHVLLFARGDETRLAAWTTATESRAVSIPASPGRFKITDPQGQPLTPLTADPKGLQITLTDSPQYLVPEAPNDLLRVAAAWQRAPLDLVLPARPWALIRMELRNPLSRPIVASAAQAWREAALASGWRNLPGTPQVEIAPGQSATLVTPFDLERNDRPLAVRLECNVEGLGNLAQVTQVMAANPLRVTFGPPLAGQLVVRVENPSGEAFRGTLRLTDSQGLSPLKQAVPLELARGQTDTDLRFPLAQRQVKDFRLGFRVEDEQGGLQLQVPAARRTLVDDFSRYSAESLPAAWRVVPDGDAKVTSTQAVTVAAVSPGLPSAAANALKIRYSMANGWKFIRLVPREATLKQIEGRPKALGLWILGDGSQNHLRLRFTDAAGQTFQPSAERMTWKGWRYVEFALDGSGAGHWGGANDGVVHYPIHWDSVLLIDGTRREAGPLEIEIVAPMLVW